MTRATMFRLEPLWPDLAVSKTGGEMIIDQPRRLHEGVAGGRSHKGKTSPPELLTHGVRFGSAGWNGFKDKFGLMKTNVCSFYCLVFVVILYFHNHRAMIGQPAISKGVLAFNFPAVGDGAISSDTG